MIKIKSAPILIVSIGLITLGIYFFAFSESDEIVSSHAIGELTVGATDFEIFVADTPELMTRGLSGRKSLKDNEGMFFIFEEEGMRTFWMKEMNFPIDIIWINSNLEIVDITKEAQPESYPELFSPVSPAQYVLEVNSGLSDEKGISIGDKIEYSL